MMDETEYLTPEEAAALLCVNRSRLYALFRGGRYGRKIDGYVVFTPEEIEQYKVERATRPKGGRANFHNRPKEIDSPAML